MRKWHGLTRKFILSFLIFGVLNTLVLVGIGGFLYRRSIIEQYEQIGYQLDSAIASTVSEEEMREISRIARDICMGTADEGEVEALWGNERFKRLDVGMDNTRDRFGAADFYIVGMVEDEVDAYIADPAGKKSPFYTIVDSIADPAYELNVGDPAPIRMVSREAGRFVENELSNVLPRIFPAFPERKEFDIYATMTPAKEVGGDFYDFFHVDDDHLAMVMADVSGKGVPAALFMVIAKTLIKNRAQMGDGPAEVLMDVNEQLCEGNEAELFVTVWLGILEISTGKGMAANAGHEHPVIRRTGGAWELVKYRHSPAVATMEGIRFREHEFELHPGDSLFVYTDGVPEATDGADTLFGTERMLSALNRRADAAPEELLHNVKEDIDAFVGEAQQFDDITMLSLTFLGVDKEA